MDNLDFSEEEIQEQLAALGYKNISKHKLREFKQNLDELVRHGEWKSLTSSTSHPNPPAFTKEKVSPCYFTGSGEGFFLHAGQGDNDRQVLSTCQNRDFGQQRCDSYARHSVALNLRLPPGAPSILQVEEEEEEEEEPDNALHPLLSDSYTSTPDTHRGHFIKRKVLRKQNGQSLVCDESFYSEDSEHPEDEEVEVQEDSKPSDEIERVIGQEELKPVADAEDSDTKVSEEDNEQVIGTEESKPVGDAEDSYPKVSEEEGEDNERENEEEDSKSVAGSEDSYQEASEEDNEQEIGEEESKSIVDSQDSYQEASEEEEEGDNEYVSDEEDSTSVGDSEDSYQEASENEEEDNEEVSKSGDAEDSCQETSGEEENGEEESKPVNDAEDSHPEASEEKEEDKDQFHDEEDSQSVTNSEESDQEASEGEENREEESKLVGDSQDSYQEASEEEKMTKEESKLVADSQDSYREASEEENGEEESKLVAYSQDSYQEASEEESGEEESKLVGDSQDSYREASEEENGKEESKLVAYSQDSYQEASEEENGEEESKLSADSQDPDQKASEEEENGEEESKLSADSQDPDQKASEEENGEEESKLVGDSYQEASEEEKIDKGESKLVGDSQDSYREASEEEENSEEESKLVDSYRETSEGEGNGEEESKLVDDSQDSYQEALEKEKIDKEESKLVVDAKNFEPEASMKIGGKESKLVGSEDSYQEASGKKEGDTEVVKDEEYTKPEEEKPDLKNQVNLSGKSLEGGSNEDDDEESCSSDSPVPSLMTSGYGTYRPEETEGVDYRDDHTITEFDQDSRGDLSEMRDDEEDDRSLYSFGGFDIEARERDYDETHPMIPEGNVECCRDEKVDILNMKTEEFEDQEDAKKCKDDLHAEFENEVLNATPQEQQYAPFKDKLDGKHLEDGIDVEGRNRYERQEDVEDKVDSEDPDESSSDNDIKFIDSKVDFSQMTFDEMCAEWEGNLRPKKDAASCLEERLADLHLSSSAQRDFETENEDISGQSDAQSSESERDSLSAFESYMRGMTRSQSDGDLRPKPKSFIRPVMSQQTIKKADPVAKYFQYKQLWEMFKLPGENNRRALRLEIKERLAYQPPPPKPRRVYVPNTYMVPTEKKRSALRWKIRNDLANGLLPHKLSYRF